jgi:dTDP-glucose pyrophosphorylase
MIIQGVNSSQDFGRAFVTLSKKNLGEHIANNIVTPFNNNLLKETVQPNDSFLYDKYKDSVDFWALAAGSGSRFKPLADEFTKITGIPANKISLPIKMDDGKEIHMLDWAMATAAPFAKDNKIEYIIAENPSGSFGDIVAYNKKMMEIGADIKDTIVCCGDNVFDVKPRELDKFMLDTIRDPKKVMGLIGVEKTVDQVADRFGVLSVTQDRGSIKDDVVSLMGFVEKPPKKEAEKLTLPNGNCVANTGMFVIKKEAMKALMDEIAVNPNVIKKSDKEPYDFANACKWVQAKYGAGACDVKLVKNWEDIGESPALFTFYNQIKNGHYLSELGKYGQMVKDSISKRFNYNENTKHGEIVLTDKYNSLDDVPASVKANTPYFEAKDKENKETLAWMKIY